MAMKANDHTKNNAMSDIMTFLFIYYCEVYNIYSLS